MKTPRYKGIHFAPQAHITSEMLYNNTALRRFMLARRLIGLMNIAVPAVVVALLLFGVI
ncbi:MAG: hypothetical protein QXP70_03650 [Methanomassiliicoccales archaeon]